MALFSLKARGTAVVASWSHVIDTGENRPALWAHHAPGEGRAVGMARETRVTMKRRCWRLTAYVALVLLLGCGGGGRSAASGGGGGGGAASSSGGLADAT